jgi:hypothetical protein
MSEKISFPELTRHDLDEKELALILFRITGQAYVFAQSSTMRWGENGKVEHQDATIFPEGFCQIMPLKHESEFDYWYGYVRSEYQFFVSPQTATLQLIYYWMKWNELGKPKPF